MRENEWGKVSKRIVTSTVWAFVNIFEWVLDTSNQDCTFSIHVAVKKCTGPGRVRNNPLILPGSRWILGRMVGMVGIWSECHFSESPPKFYLDSNPIPTKFPPNSYHSGQNHLDPCGSNSYQDPSRFQVDSKWIPPRI